MNKLKIKKFFGYFGIKLYPYQELILEKMGDKVYCSQCRYFKSTPESCYQRCLPPELKVTFDRVIDGDAVKLPRVIFGLMPLCKDLNGNNNCKYYKRMTFLQEILRRLFRWNI